MKGTVLTVFLIVYILFQRVDAVSVQTCTQIPTRLSRIGDPLGVWRSPWMVMKSWKLGKAFRDRVSLCNKILRSEK